MPRGKLSRYHSRAFAAERDPHRALDGMIAERHATATLKPGKARIVSLTPDAPRMSSDVTPQLLL